MVSGFRRVTLQEVPVTLQPVPKNCSWLSVSPLLRMRGSKSPTQADFNSCMSVVRVGDGRAPWHVPSDA